MIDFALRHATAGSCFIFYILYIEIKLSDQLRLFFDCVRIVFINYSCESMEPPAWLERPKYNLTNDERNAMLQFLLQNLKNKDTKELKRGALKMAAEKFKCNRRTVYTLWTQAKNSVDRDDAPMNVDDRRKGNGRKPLDREVYLERMRCVPLRERQTIRSLAHAIGLPPTSTFKLLQNQVKNISCTIKRNNHLNPENICFFFTLTFISTDRKVKSLFYQIF